MQGSGAQGAFTWGVLDALLEDCRIGIDGICGSSTGAMNAVVLAQGGQQGGRDGARQALADFWAASCPRARSARATAMPSICRRPKLHHTVEIEGQACWDGGYAANPAVFPLLFDCASRDLLLVPLGPLQREGTSRTSRTSRTVEAIDSRILELGFGANFMRQMRLLAHAARLARPRGSRSASAAAELSPHRCRSTAQPAAQ